MNSNIPQNYNNGKSRRGKSRPNFGYIRHHEQSVQKIRNEKGIYFTPVNGSYDNYVENEFGLEKSLKNVQQKRNKILTSRYAILNVLNTATAEYYQQPYFIREIDAINMSVDGKNILNTVPKISHKKLKKEIKDNPNNYLFYLTDIGKFDDFIEYCFYDLDTYNADNSDKKYNRNINYSNIIAKGKTLFEYHITSKITRIAQSHNIDIDLLNINFRDITLPVKVTLDNNTVSLDAYDIHCGKKMNDVVNLFNVYNKNIELKELAEQEEIKLKKVKPFKKNVYVIVNATEGKVQYVAEGLFTTLAEYIEKHGSDNLQRVFNRGDNFEVLTYTCTNKSEYKELTRTSTYAKSYKKLDLKLSQFDVTNLLNMYDDYTQEIWNNYDQKMFVKQDIRDHLKFVYGHIHNYTKKFKKGTEQKINCPVQELILNHFDVNKFKQAWHNKLFHRIVTDQKVFLKKAGLNKVLLSFSIHSQRMSKEMKRRTKILTESLTLLDKNAGLSKFTSINKIFCQGSQKPHVKQDREVAMVAVVNNVSLGDIPTPTAVNFEVSDAPTLESDYLDSLVSYANSDDFYVYNQNYEWLAE